MSDIARIIAATNYAAECHSQQRRKDVHGTPYINHPIDVANFLTSHGVTDADTIIGALLHDVIEDTKGTAVEITQKFGDKVCQIVKDCSDDKSLHKVQRKMIQITHAKDISPEAKLVKLADKYSNVSGLLDNVPRSWSKEVVLGYVYWSLAVCRNLFGINESIDVDLLVLFKKHGIDTDMSDHDLQRHLNEYYKVIFDMDEVQKPQEKIIMLSQ